MKKASGNASCVFLGYIGIVCILFFIFYRLLAHNVELHKALGRNVVFYIDSFICLFYVYIEYNFEYNNNKITSTLLISREGTK